MKNKIDCFVFSFENNCKAKIIKDLQQQPIINNISLICNAPNNVENILCEKIETKQPFSSETIQTIGEKSEADFTLLITKSEIEMGDFALERMVQIAENTDAGLVYSDFYKKKNEMLVANPLIDYQQGSLRDDFDFGSVLFFKTSRLKKNVQKISRAYQYAGFYRLKLLMAQNSGIEHINELLYIVNEEDKRTTGEKIFDYLNPNNRVVQIEMEKACTEHLKEIEAFLHPTAKTIEFAEDFEVEATVVIPVKNREKTISDAIESVLRQKTNFSFNLMVVDNHSTDKTTEIIQRYQQDNRLIHLIPTQKDLGIGGCWNWAIHNEKCGKFAIQLDSDDLYSSHFTLQKIVDTFYQQKCAMVIGTYQMSNFELELIPPGVIDHKEWTDENGKNNALRINGLGAPRAFYTPIIREINFPNTSYGEDYAVALRMAREYKIGRIYDVLYLCRRWEDNSDASLSVEKMNRYNFYKDKLRTIEVKARILQNKKMKR